MNSHNKPVAKALIVYHDKCNDGATAAWVTHCYLCSHYRVHNIHMLALNYDDTMPLLKQAELHYYSEIYVVDFSLTVSMLQYFESEFPECSISILDHHKTAFENYAPNLRHILSDSTWQGYVTKTAYALLDNAESGASLCWKRFFPNLVVPLLVTYVKDYDLYKFKKGEPTKWIRQILRRMVFSPETWSAFSKQLHNAEEHDKILAEGKALQDQEDQLVKAIAKKAVPYILNGISCWVVTCPPEYTSAVGHALALQDNSVALLAPVYTADKLYDKEHGGYFERKLCFSLRSVAGGLDVSAIAKKYGGGGHKNAAGFTSNISAVLSDKIQLMILRGII